MFLCSDFHFPLQDKGSKMKLLKMSRLRSYVQGPGFKPQYHYHKGQAVTTEYLAHNTSWPRCLSEVGSCVDVQGICILPKPILDTGVIPTGSNMSA